MSRGSPSELLNLQSAVSSQPRATMSSQCSVYRPFTIARLNSESRIPSTTRRNRISNGITRIPRVNLYPRKPVLRPRPNRRIPPVQKIIRIHPWQSPQIDTCIICPLGRRTTRIHHRKPDSHAPLSRRSRGTTFVPRQPEPHSATPREHAPNPHAGQGAGVFHFRAGAFEGGAATPPVRGVCGVQVAEDEGAVDAILGRGLDV